MNNRFGAVNARLDQHEQQHAELVTRIQALETGPSQKLDFKPQWVEIRGFCEFGESSTAGIDRAESAEVVRNLIAVLPGSLQEHVG
eukprot:9165443-Pyramimonas_sp.AAC.1